MAHDIKLHVFVLSLRERNNSKNTFKWQEVFDKFDGQSTEEKFTNLFKEYINHFAGKFIVYKNWNKGINLSTSGVTFGSQNNYIIGKFEGGYTDIVSTIKDKNNVDDQGYTVTRDHVNAMPFHFLLWLPKESNKGLLIAQSIGDRSAHEPLKLNLKKFIDSIDQKFYVDFAEHITQSAVKKMKEKGVINQLMLRKSSLSSDKVQRVFNKKYNVFDNINIEVKITGFGSSAQNAIKEFMLGKHPDLLELANLKEIGIDDGFEVVANLKHGGKTALAKMKNDFSISPVYYIDSADVSLDANNHPDEVQLKLYLATFFTEMKKEIGFKD